jgi:tetratricopeptide (TPR) repeat protein
VRYHLCGDIALLDEAIELNRKALGLRPPGHPARERSCNNLGNTLHARYEQCGDLTLLDEAIELKREALALLPPGNPERAVNCNNLANSLRTRYTQCDDLTLLDKAIELEREALALHPPGDPMRARSCNNLSASLYARYQRCDDLTLLDEVDKLVREALALRPPGHPMHLLSCRNLSYSLMNCYDRTKNSALLDEAIKPGGYALDSDTSVDASHSFAVLAQLHLIPHTSHFSIVKALHYLDLSFGSDVNDIHDLFRSTIANLFRVWDLSSIWTPETRLLLCGVYVKIIDRLPLVAGFVLNTPSQLQVLKSTHHIGTDACVAAMLAGQLSQAVELLDRSHGIVWTQALHQRDPRMEGAPPELASELERLLRAMATAAPINIGEEASYHHQDVRHKNSNMIQAILREVRAKPGLERFMLGSTYTTLREAAHNHPVVVLVAGRSQAFALIMPSSSHTSPDILRLDITSATLQSFANSVGQANLRFRECSPSGQDVPLVNLIGPDRAMRPGDHLTHRSPLARLWLSVVKPVLTHLGLTVRSPRRR